MEDSRFRTDYAQWGGASVRAEKPTFLSRAPAGVRQSRAAFHEEEDGGGEASPQSMVPSQKDEATLHAGKNHSSAVYWEW